MEKIRNTRITDGRRLKSLLAVGVLSITYLLDSGCGAGNRYSDCSEAEQAGAVPEGQVCGELIKDFNGKCPQDLVDSGVCEKGDPYARIEVVFGCDADGKFRVLSKQPIADYPIGNDNTGDVITGGVTVPRCSGDM